MDKTPKKTPKTILITGATTGIGRHAALHLARRGHRVIATGRRDDALASLRDQAAGERLAIETLVLDVTSAISIAASVRSVDALTAGRGLDALVNNAGYGQFGTVEELTDADVRKQFETNVFGLLALTRAFAPAMRERGAGRIVNVSSVGGQLSFPLCGAYHATKYAVEAFSDSLRLEMRGFGVGVSIIEPGPIRSAFADRAISSVAAYRDPASPYAAMLARGDQIIGLNERFAADPMTVSKAIAHAIEARRPRARYVRPFSSWLLLRFLRVLPTPAFDWLVARVMFQIKRPGRARRVAVAPAAAGAPPSKLAA